MLNENWMVVTWTHIFNSSSIWSEHLNTLLINLLACFIFLVHFGTNVLLSHFCSAGGCKVLEYTCSVRLLCLLSFIPKTCYDCIKLQHSFNDILLACKVYLKADVERELSKCPRCTAYRRNWQTSRMCHRTFVQLERPWIIVMFKHPFLIWVKFAFLNWIRKPSQPQDLLVKPWYWIWSLSNCCTSPAAVQTTITWA